MQCTLPSQPMHWHLGSLFNILVLFFLLSYSNVLLFLCTFTPRRKELAETHQDMSAKLLYSLSDDDPKRMGCMNGILHHFLSGRGISAHSDQHKCLPPGQSKMESKGTRREIKEKSEKEHRETPRVLAEPSMVSSASSALSSVQCQRRTQEEQTLFGESATRDMGMTQPKLSINSHQLSIRNSRKQRIINNAMKHIDSPRPLQPSNLQNQRTSTSISKSRTEHPSSVKDKKREGHTHTRRLSYDGRESRESLKSGLKLNELPRLSLDSRQGHMRSTSELKSEFLQSEEPGSNRPVSSVVTKLMGLDDIPESTPRNRGHQTRSRRSEDLDVLSRSTRSTDESDPDSERLSVSIYREIDKRLAELDFRKSGKDLRALKQILEAMQRSKSKLETACKDNQASSTSTTCMINGGRYNEIRNSQESSLANWKGSKSSSSKVADKVLTKPGKVSRGPGKPASFTFQQQMPSNLARVRVGEPASVKSDAAEKRRIRDQSPKTQHKYGGKLEKFSQERRMRSTMMNSNQEPKILLKKKMQSSGKMEAKSKKVVQRKLELDDQHDVVHTPRPSQKLYKTVGHGVNVIEESTTPLKEQPSPVSVLDAEFYGDESPSPVKKKATAFRDDYTNAMSTRAEWIAVDTNHLSNSIRSCFSSDNGYDMEKAKEAPSNNLWLVRESCTERSRLQAKSSYPSIDDENDFLRSIIAKDLARRSESWTDFGSENSWLVLDIERLVFKDLIDELVHEDASR